MPPDAFGCSRRTPRATTNAAYLYLGTVERVGAEDQGGALGVLAVADGDGAGDECGGRFDAVAAVAAAVAALVPGG
jgi:hypothetical protein